MDSRQIRLLLLGLPLLASVVSAQSGQGVLVDGNSQLPACAQSCTLLNQAAQACTATTGAATQANWICFCQSAYLNTLRSSAVGVCDSACTDATQNAQISTWYNANCGSDNGASEHASDGTSNTGSSSNTNTNANTNTGSSSNTNTNTGSSNTNTNTNTHHSGSGSSGSNANVSTDSSSNQTWWQGHYQWIIMVIVLAISLSLFAWLLTYLKKRHALARDKITGGFNAGITTRSAGGPSSSDREKAAAGNTHLHPSSAAGRDSPVRTRENFMPYGYPYAGSDSRLASRSDVDAIPLEEKKSPLARSAPVSADDLNLEEKDVENLGPWPVPARSEKRGIGRAR